MGWIGYRARCRKCGEWVEDAMEAASIKEVQNKLGHPACIEDGCDGTCMVTQDPYFEG